MLYSQKKLQYDAHMLKEKGMVIGAQIKDTMLHKVMKKTTFWQCILTILTYIIFALNAFITGFGLANLGNTQQQA